MRRRHADVAIGAVVLAIMAGGVFPAAARTRSSPVRGPALFDRLAGQWAGTGHAGPLNAPGDPVQCSAAFSPAGEARLHMLLECASRGYRVAVSGELSRDGERVTGTLKETSYGIAGTVYGILGSGGLQGIVSGMGVSASMTLRLQGDRQSVTLQGVGALKAGAAVTLRRV